MALRSLSGSRAWTRTSSRPPLQPHHLLAEERGADLMGEVVETEAQRPGLGLQVELNLPDTLVPVRPHIEDARPPAQELRDGIGDGGQPSRIRMREFHVYGPAQIDEIGAEGQAAMGSDRGGLLAPRLLKDGSGDRPPIGVEKPELHGCDVRSRG